jgi:hypothetical protein
MPKLSEVPNTIFTSSLFVLGICYFHKFSAFYIFCYYYDLLSGELQPIEVRTDFETLYNLLSEIGKDGEETIDELSKFIPGSAEEISVINFGDEKQPLYLEHHFFAFMLTMEEDEDMDDDVDEISYQLTGFLRHDSLSEIICLEMPYENNAELVEYYNEILAVQYLFYLHFKKSEEEEWARSLSNLGQPLMFALAKAQYNLLKKNKSDADYFPGGF